MKRYLSSILAACMVSACQPVDQIPGVFDRVGIIENARLDEASGMQRSLKYPGIVYLHNDDGPPEIYIADEMGRDLGTFIVKGARNRDWEDITAVPDTRQPLVVGADTGDNGARWDSVDLYFFFEPERGPENGFSTEVELLHTISLRYPDGARDCESVAYDARNERLLFMTKRDRPPRLYAIGIEEALSQDESVLEFLGEAWSFREPSLEDLELFGARDGPWVAQPTGMDISPDGRRAAVISYRSLYIFDRAPEQNWAEALASKPREYPGPDSYKEEAVTFLADGRTVLVTTERRPAAWYQAKIGDASVSEP